MAEQYLREDRGKNCRTLARGFKVEWFKKRIERAAILDVCYVLRVPSKRIWRQPVLNKALHY